MAGIEVLRFTIGPFQENAYLLVGPSGRNAALVDPGFESEPILETITGRGLALAWILNTHGHLDHVAGNRFFKEQTGALLAIHTLDVPYLERIEMQAEMFGLTARNSPLPDRLLEEGVPVAFDGLEIEVIHTPGHTPGGVCLRLGKTMFVGDTLFRGSIGRTDFPGGSLPDLVRSIRGKLYRLPDDTVCHPGHEDSTTIGEERRHNQFVPDPTLHPGMEERP